jgi:hypothetical protein
MIEAEIKDSLTRLEEAYINSLEYKNIYREKNWIIVVGLITTLLTIISVLVFI